MKSKINWFLFILTELILIGFLTGYISVQTYYDGGRVYRLTVLGAEYTLIDEPAEQRRIEEEGR